MWRLNYYFVYVPSAYKSRNDSRLPTRSGAIRSGQVLSESVLVLTRYVHWTQLVRVREIHGFAMTNFLKSLNCPKKSCAKSRVITVSPGFQSWDHTISEWKSLRLCYWNMEHGTWDFWKLATNLSLVQGQILFWKLENSGKLEPVDFFVKPLRLYREL